MTTGRGYFRHWRWDLCGEPSTHQAAPAICGVPGMMLSAPRSYPEGPQSPHGDLPKGRGESKVQQARKPL